MNKQYQILYLPLFYEDLMKIIKYIKVKLKNPIAAKHLIIEIEKAITDRAYNPNDYEKYNSNKKRKDTYYRIYVKNYTIFYTLQGNIMNVRRILYSRRNFKNII